MKNEYGQLERDLADLSARIEKLQQKRASSALSISVKAEQAHKEVLAGINTFSPHPIKRKVFSSRQILGNGCLVEVEGLTHVLIHQDVADFFPSIDYSAFRLKNYPAVSSPKEYFKNVVAHEYGHILFSERIRPHLNYQLGGSSYDLNTFSSSIVNELDEAFAFSFGDRITGSKSLIVELAEGYRKEDFDPAKMISLYHKVNKLANSEGYRAVFDSMKLAKILEETK